MLVKMVTFTWTCDQCGAQVNQMVNDRDRHSVSRPRGWQEFGMRHLCPKHEMVVKDRDNGDAGVRN